MPWAKLLPDWIIIFYVKSTCILTTSGLWANNSLVKWAPGYFRKTTSIPWLLMTWILESSDHHDPWYWLCEAAVYLSFVGKAMSFYFGGITSNVHTNLYFVHKNSACIWDNPKIAEKSLNIVWPILISLQWCHNKHDGVSNHQPKDCLFKAQIKENIKAPVTGLGEGNSPVTGEFPTQRANNAENASIWWRHHVWSAKYHQNKLEVRQEFF